MTRPRRRRNRPLVLALYLNAAVLAAILVVLVSRGGLGVGSAAMAAPQPQPIAGGGGLFLMPAQFSPNMWGCYIMDIDAQTLAAYQYVPAQNQLRLAASRFFRFDRQLKAYNTWPLPPEVQHLVELEKAGVRGKTDDQGNDPANSEPASGAEPGGAPIAPATRPPDEPAGSTNDPANGASPAASPPSPPTESKEAGTNEPAVVPSHP